MRQVRNKAGLLAIFLLFGFLLQSCTSTQSPLDSAKAFSTWANHVYSQQYDSYLKEISASSLTADEVIYLQKKKGALIRLDSLLNLYDSVLDLNSVPSADLESQINSLAEKIITGVL